MEYKEMSAIGIVTLMLTDGVITQEQAAKYFPELAESEDEKIRKEIIDFIYDKTDTYELREKSNSWLAWLEKQSMPQERTGLEWVNTIDDACDKRYSEEYAHGEYCHEQSFKWGFQEGVAWFEKQGEQKPEIKYVYPKFRVGDVIVPKEPNGYFVPERVKYIGEGCYHCESDDRKSFTSFPICKEDEYKLVEQKTAEWEPQTGDTFRKKGTTSPTYHLCDKREDGIHFGFVENRKVGISGGEITVLNLKENYELVERPKPIEQVVEEEFKKVIQPKVEWSEEDNYVYNEILKRVADGKLYEHDLEYIYKWLKSLKPQKRWKPSDEQMDNLSRAFNGAIYNNSLLMDLYIDLKKLK